MKVALRVDGTLGSPGGEIAFGPTLALLDAVAGTGSVQGAATGLGLSYRSAWGRFAGLEAALGRPVIAKTKGHGSVLTPFGAALRAALSESVGRFAAAIAAEAPLLEARLAALVDPRPTTLRLAVSHDSVLLEALAEFGDVAVTTAGSTDALDRLGAGLVDAAGFHFGAAVPEPGTVFSAILSDPGLRTLPVLRREQGLMLAAGNPRGIAGLSDLARPGIRFVNRQRGAGTRIWFDRLCAEAGLRPETIAGYDTEEFTHQAVAGLIAAGAADVGMGTRAAAARFGLGFLSLGEETYFLAIGPAVNAARIDPIVAAIRLRASATLGYAPMA